MRSSSPETFSIAPAPASARAAAAINSLTSGFGVGASVSRTVGSVPVTVTNNGNVAASGQLQVACDLLMSLGQSEVSLHSERLFGRPGLVLHGSTPVRARGVVRGV